MCVYARARFPSILHVVTFIGTSKEILEKHNIYTCLYICFYVVLRFLETESTYRTEGGTIWWGRG